MSKRKQHAPEFKAKVALEALKARRRLPNWQQFGCIRR